jgi:hypothetical protein
MKMAKPSERDIDAAGNLLSLLLQIDRGDYPNLDESDDVPDWFDEDNFDHLRAFYDAVKATLEKGPGFPGRVIGGMCYVIMYDKNEIIDPASDTIDLHPKLVEALRFQDAATAAARDVLAERRRQVDAEGYEPEHDDDHVLGEIGAYAAYYAMPPGVREWPATETGYADTFGEAIVPDGWTPTPPGDRRRELVKAGALVLAEIERLDRVAARVSESGGAA